MSNEKGAAKGGACLLAKILYVAAVVMAVIFVFMLVVNIQYIDNYTTSYGMGFGDMWKDGLQYIISGSIIYLVYGLILFALGKILCAVRCDKDDSAADETEAEETPAVAQIEEATEEAEEAEAEVEAEAEEAEEDAKEAEEAADEAEEDAEEKDETEEKEDK